MSRWSTRLRRAASLLLGGQLLQVILLAASAVCDPAAGAVTAVPVSAGAVPAASVPVHHHGEHVAQGTVPAEPSPAPAHHAPAANCPMAMACTVTAMLADVPTIATRTVIVPVMALSHNAQAPASVRAAPETPPPRA